MELTVGILKQIAPRPPNPQPEEEILDFDYVDSGDYPHGRATELPIGNGG